MDDDRELLRWLAEGTAATTGYDFFRVLVDHMSTAIGTAGAWVSTYLPETRQLRAIAMKMGDRWLDGYAYAIDGSPCETSIDRGEQVFIPERVIELYPGESPLAVPSMAARIAPVSYLGVPLFDADGTTTIGHLAVLHDAPLVEARSVPVFRIFAARAAAELRRLRAEAEVREREVQLTCLLDGTMDAIVGLDAELRITFLNGAAVRALGETTGRSGESLPPRLTPASATRLRAVANRLVAGEAPGVSHRLHGGLEVTPDGTPRFQAEATLSHHLHHGDRRFTLVLRDVNDRLAAEEKIRTLEQRAEVLREEIDRAHGFDEIVGNSPALRGALDDVTRVAPMNTTVLLLGETGTGKELFARAIHQASPRRDRPLIKLNCAAIPRDLIESELFGHERGAFTGATAKREGRFALAHGGTLFLDELGELPLALQAKMLRVLQEGEFEPVGSEKTRKVDVRVVAATNRDLAATVRRGEFREDLYYRLNVFPIAIPPLRDRGDDIVRLAERFVAVAERRIGRRLEPLSAACRERLMRYPWPGNVRELANVIERAAIHAVDGRLDLQRALAAVEVKPALETGPAATPAAGAAGSLLTEEGLRALERDNITRALAQAGGKVSGPGGAAELLAMNPSTLASRIRALGIGRRADAP